MSEKRVVWVLGAGFSRPLGGPLLADLFQEKFDLSVLGSLPAATAEALAPEFRRLRHLYYGQVSDPASRYALLGGPWTDAEQLVEYIDLASSGDKRAQQTIRNVLERRAASYGYGHEDGSIFPKMAIEVRRYFACACHHFVEPQSLVRQLERWSPYCGWVRHILPGDHVLTFNYDLVVERIASPRIQRFVPGRAFHPSYNDQSFLLKLHGSVDWLLKGEELEEVDDPWDHLAANALPFAIGMPGSSKGNLVAKHLRDTWDLAALLLDRATHVVFVGYRMPEGDAYSRSWMLDKLGNAPLKPKVHVVLGPRRDEYVDRLDGLLGWALGNGRVTVEPMWGQDFLAVFNRDKL